MKSQIWFLYGITCTCMAMYICWNMGAMTSQPRFRIFCQQYMKDSGDNMRYGQTNNTITESPHLTTSTFTRLSTTDTTTPVPAPVYTFPPTIVNGSDINPAISKFFTMAYNERKDPFINLHRYEFTLNSEVCSNKSLFLIMIIHSAPRNFKKRDLIRTTYGSVHSYEDKRLAVVFMLGFVSDKTVQKAVYRESQHYGDIIQGNFLDSYKSLNRKHIMAMHWFKSDCKAEYILKLDDDTFVNPFRIIDYILQVKLKGMTMHCKLISGEGPVRSSSSKWYTPKSQYPFRLLPSFCLGFAYITTPEAWMAMYKASENNRLMNMDDLYVSVVLAMKAKVQKVDLKMMYACPANVTVSVETLNQRTVFIDRRNRCGQKPFHLWNKIRKLNRQHRHFY